MKISLPGRKNVDLFKRYFKGLNLMHYWDKLTGFDVMKFDEEIAPADGQSLEEKLVADYGQDAAEFAESLIDYGQPYV